MHYGLAVKPAKERGKEMRKREKQRNEKKQKRNKEYKERREKRINEKKKIESKVNRRQTGSEIKCKERFKYCEKILKSETIISFYAISNPSHLIVIHH
jgi:hypothetical protein